MNILFWCGDFYPNLGGATSLVDDLARVLLSTGHTVTVLTRSAPGSAAIETYHDYEIHRITYPIPYERFYWHRGVVLRSFPILAQVRALFRRRSITTVCIGLLDMSAWYAFLLRRLFRFRLVLYLHGGETRLLPTREPSYARLLRQALREADAVIAVSSELKREAAHYWPAAEAKTHVIENAIAVQQPTATRFGHSRPYIAAVGRLVEEKDFETLIRAYAKVQQEIGDVDLVIAGEGNRATALRKAADACPNPDRVIFLGRAERETALSVMKGALFAVLPSLTEGFPIVAVEAIALGKPLIGTAIPGIQAVVEDGRTGDLFRPGDVDALAHLLRLYCQDRDYLSKVTAAAAAIDLSRYDLSQVAARHLKVYRDAE